MNGYVLTFGYLWVVLSIVLWGVTKEFDADRLIESLFQISCVFGLWVPLTYAFFRMFYHNVLKGGKKGSKDDKK